MSDIYLTLLAIVYVTIGFLLAYFLVYMCSEIYLALHEKIFGDQKSV